MYGHKLNFKAHFMFLIPLRDNKFLPFLSSRSSFLHIMIIHNGIFCKDELRIDTFTTSIQKSVIWTAMHVRAKIHQIYNLFDKDCKNLVHFSDNFSFSLLMNSRLLYQNYLFINLTCLLKHSSCSFVTYFQKQAKVLN